MSRPKSNSKPPDISRLLDLRHRLEYLLLRGIIAVVRAFGLDRGVRISAFAWRLIAPRLRRHKRALANLKLAFPEKTDFERQQIALDMWENLGRVIAEAMQMDRILADPSRIELVNQNILERYRGKLGPFIGVSLHMGNWELAVWPLTVAGANPAAVYRTIKNPYVDQYVRDQRKQLYPAGLFGKGKVYGSRDEGQKTARLITDYVRRGGRLGLICDLYDRHGIAAPFFGHRAKSVAIPAMIARRVGARIWIARCLRLGKQSRFKVECKELKVPRTRSQADDIRWVTYEMQKQFEAWIRENPEQWMWSNRRWS